MTISNSYSFQQRRTGMKYLTQKESRLWKWHVSSAMSLVSFCLKKYDTNYQSLLQNVYSFIPIIKWLKDFRSHVLTNLLGGLTSWNLEIEVRESSICLCYLKGMELGSVLISKLMTERFLWWHKKNQIDS